MYNYVHTHTTHCAYMHILGSLTHQPVGTTIISQEMHNYTHYHESLTFTENVLFHVQGSDVQCMLHECLYFK